MNTSKIPYHEAAMLRLLLSTNDPLAVMDCIAELWKNVGAHAPTDMAIAGSFAVQAANAIRESRRVFNGAK